VQANAAGDAGKLARILAADASRPGAEIKMFSKIKAALVAAMRPDDSGAVLRRLDLARFLPLFRQRARRGHHPQDGAEPPTGGKPQWRSGCLPTVEPRA
jgi:hypothetical protein